MKSIVGTVLHDRYYVVRELQQEEFSNLYLAEDRGLERPVPCLIDRLHPKYSSEVLGSRSWSNIYKLFLQAANSRQNLGNHPQIPQLLAYFTEEREFYLVKEFIDGESLAARIHNCFIDETEAVYWLQEALTILDFIHQKSVIHLNIKPSSLLKETRTGKIFLTNFGGIKKAILPPEQQGSLIIGDRDYLAPEQQEGKPNFTSDIYALGKTIIYALTGDDNLQNSEYLSLSNNLASTQNINNAPSIISNQLTKILDKMTADSSAQRYQSAIEVLAALDRKPNVVSFPPPFINAPTLIHNRHVEQSEPSSFQLAKILIWSLLILPFLGAAIAFVIGVNKNRYKGFVVYSNETYNFTLNYPETWQVRELDDPITGEVVVFSSPAESNFDSFSEKIYISVEYLARDINSLDQYTQTIVERIKQENGDEVEVYKEKRTKLGRYPARMVIYSRQENGLLLRQLEAFTIKNNRVYVITYTAERVKFSKFLRTAQKMLKSWEIK